MASALPPGFGPAQTRRIVPVTPEKFRIGLVQMSCSPDQDDNLDRAVERIRQAARQGAQIVCLQELFRSQYFCREEDAARFELAEPIPGPTTELLSRIARERSEE